MIAFVGGAGLGGAALVGPVGPAVGTLRRIALDVLVAALGARVRLGGLGSICRLIPAVVPVSSGSETVSTRLGDVRAPARTAVRASAASWPPTTPTWSPTRSTLAMTKSCFGPMNSGRRKRTDATSGKAASACDQRIAATGRARFAGEEDPVAVDQHHRHHAEQHAHQDGARGVPHARHR